MSVGLQREHAVTSSEEPSIRACTIRCPWAVSLKLRIGMTPPTYDAYNLPARDSPALRRPDWTKPVGAQSLSYSRSTASDDRLPQSFRAAGRDFTQCLLPGNNDGDVLERRNAPWSVHLGVVAVPL